MSLDLKIEIFGYHIFDDVFLERGVSETDQYFLQIYTEECIKDKSFTEAYDNVFLDAYYIREFLFETLLVEEIEVNEVRNWRCLFDFYDHVNRICNREDLFGHLNIFDKMLATCVYVVNLCIYIHKETIVDVINYGYIVWAMYFDQFSEKFYEEGGWKELKNVSKSYNSFYHFLTHFKVRDFRFLKEASINYCRFKRDVISQEGTKHISKLWIKFHVRHFKEYALIQTWYESFADCYEIEILLQGLKLICNSFLEFGTDRDKMFQENFQRKFCFSDVSDSKINNMFEALKNIDSECKRTIERFKTLFQDENSTTSEETAASALVDKVEDCKSSKSNSLEEGIFGNKNSKILAKHSSFRLTDLKQENMFSVIETRFKFAEETANLDLDYHYTSFDKEKERVKNNTKGLKQFDTSEASNSVSTKRNCNEERVGLKRFYPDNLPNKTDLDSDYKVKENSNLNESLNSASDLNFSTKSVELCCENIKLTDVSSIDPISVNLCRGNAIQKTPSSSKDYPIRIGIAHEADERINTPKGLYKLRKEQNDPKMRNFMRMILILGDIQGIQYVCGKFCNSDSDRNKSNAKLNMGKKKTQKKSRM